MKPNQGIATKAMSRACSIFRAVAKSTTTMVHIRTTIPHEEPVVAMIWIDKSRKGQPR